MKMNLFTALPLEMAASAIDALCKCTNCQTKSVQGLNQYYVFRFLYIIYGRAASNNSGYNKNALSIHDAMSEL